MGIERTQRILFNNSDEVKQVVRDFTDAILIVVMENRVLSIVKDVILIVMMYNRVVVLVRYLMLIAVNLNSLVSVIRDFI